MIESRLRELASELRGIVRRVEEEYPTSSGSKYHVVFIQMAEKFEAEADEIEMENIIEFQREAIR